MSVRYPEIGDPVFDADIRDMAEKIVQLQRQLAALKLTGGAAGCYIGTVQEGPGGIGITAAVDNDTPGYGTVLIRQAYPIATTGQFKLRDSGILVPVMNIAQGTLGGIEAGKQIATMPILNKPGHQLVILDPCPPT